MRVTVLTEDAMYILALDIHAMWGLFVLNLHRIWRKGNIDIFCEEFLIKQVADLENAVKLIVAD
jgi:hypothetical protein